MSQDGWKGYAKYKTGNAPAERYYGLIRTVFFTAVARMCGNGQVERALDLGCGSGELTRGLLKYARRVTGVDSSLGLISQAKESCGADNPEFILANALDVDHMGELPEGGFDLVTAAWLHNHLPTRDQQDRLRSSILRLLRPEGRIVFLIPGQGFTTPRARDFFETLGWRQAWLGEDEYRKHGVYSFADSPWQELWVWSPMWLGGVYARNFQVSFLDVKGIALDHDGLGEPPLEPPFEVLMGTRRP